MRLSHLCRQADKGPRLESSRKSKCNKALYDLGETYWPSIPWDKIDDLLKKNGVVALQEDNTEWSGFFTGRDGKAIIDLAPLDSGRSEHRPATFYTPYSNSSLVMTWHKMESGRYEIVAYLS